MTTVLTVGHGTRTIEELIETLRAGHADKVVDVRRFPGSRRHPQFSRASLEASLAAASLDYDWRGEALGGRRENREGRPSRHHSLRVAAFRNYADHMDTPEFRGALERLESDAHHERLAIMCAETPWWRCHRRLISDALALDGFQVVHLMDARTSRRHRLHDVVRADENGRPVYDAGKPPV